MFMHPLLNSFFIYQALIPQFICGIYCFLRKIATICWIGVIIMILLIYLILVQKHKDVPIGICFSIPSSP